MQYYGTRLSENISRREPEGYLLCLNVPVARTGMQEYLPEELGMPGNSPVPVIRPEEEVFSEATIASFEGMPVTNDHPPDGVDVFNIRAGCRSPTIIRPTGWMFSISAPCRKATPTTCGGAAGKSPTCSWRT